MLKTEVGPSLCSFRACLSLINWPAVIDILETPALRLVMIDLPSGLIIPQRCFGSEIECHEFVEARRQHSPAMSLGS